MKRIVLLFAVMLVSIMGLAGNELEMVVKSPDGQNVIRFRYNSLETGGQLTYDVIYNGKAVILESQAGLNLDNKVWESALAKKYEQVDCWMNNFGVDSVGYSAFDETWIPVVGERSAIKNNYNSGVLYLSKKDGSDYRLNVEVRAYDEGVGFRYHFPEHPDAVFHKVVADLTEYTFEPGAKAWVAKWAQAPYELLPINEIKEPAERALTVELSNGLWASLTDADVDDWCQTRFIASETKPNTLVSEMYSIVDVVTYASTPWKVILVAEKAGDLIENNDIVLNFNPPCEIKNTDYIKPGTMFRDTRLTTESALEAVDLCVERNIPYVLFCWKWYMPVTSHDGDALTPVDKLDLQKAISYAHEKGIGVWLYLNQHALMKPNIEEVLATIKSWGVVGIKPGFVEYCSHRWAVWVHDIVRLAAKYDLMVNIHDEFRPSGFSRTYPNLITQEGIRGNEEFPDATHNTVLPFTRMINGAGDYTICYYDNRLKNTHAHQLALSLIMYSPVESVFWYDVPSRFNDEPELEWFDNLKTSFDESHVLDGKPGENITMARRNGEDWWIGVITNNNPSERSVNMSFLPDGQVYKASIYTDDDKMTTKTKVRCTYLLVSREDILDFSLKAKGGAAIHLTPVEKSEKKSYKRYRGQVL